MKICMDFLNWLEPDMAFKIFSSLEDPSDIVRIGCVSRSWKRFVVANGLCKQLCLRMFPQLKSVASVAELNNTEATEPAEVGSSNSIEWETLEREHRVYALLARGITSFVADDCISEAISASSTDNYPDESIHNTLDERDRFPRRTSYWSSKGQKNPVVPETLIYKLVSDICVLTEINIQPFQGEEIIQTDQRNQNHDILTYTRRKSHQKNQGLCVILESEQSSNSRNGTQDFTAFFQHGSPIYSAKSVRFRMGHPKSLLDFGIDSIGESCHDDKFSWTYTSPIFEMTQENRLQIFKLPEPVLCVGGFLQIELLGRVQRQDVDGLFYICVCHVKAKGRSLSPAFSVEVLEPSGKFVLKNNVQAKGSFQPSLSKCQAITSVIFERRARDLQQIVNMLLEEFDGENIDDEEEDDSDEELYI